MTTPSFLKTLAPQGHGLVDGMGYKTAFIQPGPGFSYTRFAHKKLRNAWQVNLEEKFPSPFSDAEQITAQYTVWIGQTLNGENDPCPFPLPSTASAEAWAPDGEIDWFANFGDNGAAAETFALTL